MIRRNLYNAHVFVFSQREKAVLYLTRGASVYLIFSRGAGSDQQPQIAYWSHDRGFSRTMVPIILSFLRATPV